MTGSWRLAPGGRYGWLSVFSVFLAVLWVSAAAAEPKWLTLPNTPELPTTSRSGSVAHDGAELWYAAYGSGELVIMLHGGLANSNYWGHQVAELAKSYQVIVMDSRGHGRSTRDGRAFSYDLMALDVIALMDHLNLSKAAIIGWSDGAIIGLSLAMRSPERISGVFAFGANSTPQGTYDPDKVDLFQTYRARAGEEYARLSRTGVAYSVFYDEMFAMWGSQPNFTAQDLQGIKVPVWVVDGEHEELIKRTDTQFIADNIPNSGLLIQPGVSHFSLLQDPQQFTADVLCFLRVKGLGNQPTALAGCRSK